MKDKLITALFYVIVIGLVTFAACGVDRKQNSIEYYNVYYTQNGVTTVYHDVTDLSKWEGKITFITEDGITVVLSDGCIEIVPIDVD
jgi:hypothetical protein